MRLPEDSLSVDALKEYILSGILCEAEKSDGHAVSKEIRIALPENLCKAGPEFAKIRQETASSLLEQTIFLKEADGAFQCFGIMSAVDYQSGVFHVMLEPKFRQCLEKKEQREQVLDVLAKLVFKSNFITRIYCYLRGEYDAKSTDHEEVRVECSLNRLRFISGAAWTPLECVDFQEEADRYWDELYAGLHRKERKYDTWSEFERHVLKPTRMKTAEKGSIRFDYAVDRRRRGKQISHVLFTIMGNDRHIDQTICQKGYSK